MGHSVYIIRGQFLSVSHGCTMKWRKQNRHQRDNKFKKLTVDLSTRVYKKWILKYIRSLRSVTYFEIETTFSRPARLGYTRPNIRRIYRGTMQAALIAQTPLLSHTFLLSIHSSCHSTIYTCMYIYRVFLYFCAYVLVVFFLLFVIIKVHTNLCPILDGYGVITVLISE
jgi:hypothetical protein